MPQRKIVEIDEAKCNGCGQCVSACAEGAIQIVEGKARLVSDVYCDGLGACLGECPQGAISVVQREAESFDEEATRRHLAGQAVKKALSPRPSACPGAAPRTFDLNVLPGGAALRQNPARGVSSAASALSHWPIQLRLVPPTAPFLQNADLLLVADCVPFACADFHQRWLRGRPVVIGCPKLDERQAALDKLTAIVTLSAVRSLTVVHMEVPCCLGLVRMAEAALVASGKTIPLEKVTISIRGQEIPQSPA